MPPLVTAVTAIANAIGFSAAASAWIGAFVVRMAFSAALSALARARQKRKSFDTPGIRTNVTLTGGDEPQVVILGRYATGGQLVTPPMSHGQAGKTPNAYRTYVIAISDVPGVTLSRLFVDGEVCVPTGGPVHPSYGQPMTFKGSAGYVWVKWYDGNQTAADPMLLSTYGAHPRRPWLADMVGTGVAYAIVTFRTDRTLFKADPAVRFEVDGIPLYDPRKDPSRGGVGNHNWNNRSTWSQTNNPMVMAYNIARGITIPGGDVWGGGYDDADLPLSNWIAAMNTCDQPVPLAAGGTVIRYRAGLEVTVDDEPVDVIEELLKTCAGRIADIGGILKVVAGPPGLPVKGFSDNDIIITDEQSASLFPSLAQTHNGVHATFPDPGSLWESRDAPPRYDAAAEAADGRRLVGTVSLPACPYPNQVQRLMTGWIKEERRFRRHQHVLPPDATILEPLDVISWTSVRNGYSAKLFEVDEIVHDPVSLLQAASLREVDPADYDWDTSLELPWVAPVTGSNLPDPQAVPNFTATGISLDDANGDPRRPAILLTWDGDDQDDVAALEYELRLLGGTQIVKGATLDVAAGSLVILPGILPDTVYQVRAKFVAPRPVLWTAWTTVTTPQDFISPSDFGSQLDLWFSQAGISVPRLVQNLPPNDGNRVDDEWVYLVPVKKLFRWSQAIGDWVAMVDPDDIPDGTISGQKVAFATLVAGLFAAGAIKAGDLDIDGNLRLDKSGAGFSIGKDSAADRDNTGLYAGRSVSPSGGVGFAFMLGTTSLSGVERYIEASDGTGLTAINMAHGLLTDISTAAVYYATSQTVVLPVGTKTISMNILGGGGGPTTGGNGGQTKVQLYNNGAPTGIQWVSNGGAAGATGTLNGQSSVFGAGGTNGGRSRQTQNTSQGPNYTYTNYSGVSATGYGAGAGGYSDPWSTPQVTRYGGGAAVNTQVVGYDISAYSNPSLVIAIGAAGASPYAWKASAGVVTVRRSARTIVPAGVLPFAPTHSGTFAKPAGGGAFPNLGLKGLWVISGVGAATLDMNVHIDNSGSVLELSNETTAAFVSDIWPVITYSSPNARTIRYAFYRMNVEG